MVALLLASVLAVSGLSDGKIVSQQAMVGGVVLQDPSGGPGVIASLACPFGTPGQYADGSTALCGTSDPWTGTAITFTRSSAAGFDINGVTTVAPADTLRVSQNGAMLEGLGKNWIQYSDELDNAWWTGHGADSYTYNDAACETGFVRVYSSGGFRATYANIAMTGADHTHVSLYAHAPFGSGTASVTVMHAAAGGPCSGCGSSDGAACTPWIFSSNCFGTFTLTETPQRYWVWGGQYGGPGTPTIAAGFHVGPDYLTGGDICVHGVQLETNHSSTPDSYIPTAGTAAERQPDALDITNVLTSEVEWCVDFTTKANGDWQWGTATNDGVAVIEAGTGADSWRLHTLMNGYTLVWEVDSGQGDYGDIRPLRTSGSTIRTSVGESLAGIYLDGSLFELNDTATSVSDPQPSTIRLGGGLIGDPMPGAYKNFRIFKAPCSKVRAP